MPFTSKKQRPKQIRCIAAPNEYFFEENIGEKLEVGKTYNVENPIYACPEDEDDRDYCDACTNCDIDANNKSYVVYTPAKNPSVTGNIKPRGYALYAPVRFFEVVRGTTKELMQSVRTIHDV